MTKLQPQELASLWYLRFGDKWVVRTDLDQEWKDIGRELMQNNLAEYDLVSNVNTNSVITTEIIKLKESYK